MEWINPDKELPRVTAEVIIAIGTQQHKVDDYKLATVGSGGAFVVSAYPQCNCLYSEKSPHRTNNAYRVIAWAEFEKCDVNQIIED